MVLLLSVSACTLTPETCDPLLPDIGVSKALGCWLSGNTEANIENIRRELRTLYSQIELQEIALRQIENSSAKLATDIDAYRAYTRRVQNEVQALRVKLERASLNNERQQVTRDALALEASSLQQQLALALESDLPEAEEIAALQRDVARKQSALEAMTDTILVE